MGEQSGRFRAYFHEALKSPIVIFALVTLAILAIGAPFFGMSS
jgi:hypothetical protein